jgi:hypothetical protein
MCSKNWLKASSPPAEAPIPTIRSERLSTGLSFTNKDLFVFFADGRFADLREVGFFIDP